MRIYSLKVRDDALKDPGYGWCSFFAAGCSQHKCREH